MQITNKTRYSTKALRQIFFLCMARVRPDYRLDWDKVRKLRVTVTYARRKYFVSGHAMVNHGRMTISIPSVWDFTDASDKTKLRPGHRHSDPIQVIAGTFIHELGHNLGVHKHVHSEAAGWACLTIEQHYEEWIYETFDATKFSIEPAPKVKPSREAVVLAKFQKAMDNLMRAAKRLKTADRLFTKWQRKVKYYEQRLPHAALQLDPAERVRAPRKRKAKPGMRAVANSFGASVSRNGDMFEVDAPKGQLWRGDGLHSMIGTPAELVERMKDGLTACTETDCDWCSPEVTS